jgi:hypothetical protein
MVEMGDGDRALVKSKIASSLPAANRKEHSHEEAR